MSAVCGTEDRTDELRASDCSSVALGAQLCLRGRPVGTPHAWLRAELAPAGSAPLCSWLLPRLLCLPLAPLVDQLHSAKASWPGYGRGSQTATSRAPVFLSQTSSL